MSTLDELLNTCAVLHQHLCPRQVLGVRMGLLGGRLLGLEVPQTDKRLLTFIELDGCGADGIAVATGCRVGRRTLRVLDYGKTAATFVDTHTQRAFRVRPRPEARDHAQAYAPEATTRWEGYLLGYQRMPEEELLEAQEVALTWSLEKLLSKHGYRVTCEACGEEIINEREVVVRGRVLCQACAYGSYFHTKDETTDMIDLLPTDVTQANWEQEDRLLWGIPRKIQA